MPAIHKLTQGDINRAETKVAATTQPIGGLPDLFRLSDGGGLLLHVRYGGAMTWEVQVTVRRPFGRGKRCAVGLGRYPVVALKDARRLAAEAQAIAHEGIDPRKALKDRIVANQKHRPTFKEICDLTFDAKKAELKGDGKAGLWMSPLENHVIPVLGDMPVEDITQHTLVSLLRPMWQDKYPTALKALTRVGIVLKHAAAMDLDIDMQVVAKAKALLGRSNHSTKNADAMPWLEVPEFYAGLDDDRVSHLALKLVILTGARFSMVKKAHRDQFDGNVWTVPGDNMKGMKGKTPDFRIPLSKEARRVVDIALAESKSGYLFANENHGLISNLGINYPLQRAKSPATVHGFRTTILSWMQVNTDAPFEVREWMLAHKVGGSVSQAYNREDYLEKRAVLIEQWGEYISGGSNNIK